VIVLGFDTATAATAVALRLADGTTLRARDDPGSGQRPGHTTRLLPLARELLAQADLPWTALERVAVGVGPGTFTGLRIGIATARGLAQALAIDAVGVSTPRVLAQAAIAAAAASREGAPGASGDGVLAVIDARRGEAFVAAFAPRELSAAGGSLPEGNGGEDDVDAHCDVDVHFDVDAHCGAEASPSGPRRGVRELSEVRALVPAELAGVARAAGPGRGWRAVGDGAVRFRAELQGAGIAVAADDSPLHRVDAGVLCELALTAPHGAPEAVLPDYRRRPDAEIALENAQQ
jgi:tRNA threonylcarbamoyladenosine biosynthesis protein TsaB